MKKQLLLRLEPSQLDQLKEAAGCFQETVTAFMVNSALLRMQSGVSPKTSDPFEEALKNLRQTKALVTLSPQARAAANANREAVKNGTAKGVSAEKALQRLKARMNS